MLKGDIWRPISSIRLDLVRTQSRPVGRLIWSLQSRGFLGIKSLYGTSLYRHTKDIMDGMCNTDSVSVSHLDCPAPLWSPD